MEPGHSSRLCHIFKKDAGCRILPCSRNSTNLTLPQLQYVRISFDFLSVLTPTLLAISLSVSVRWMGAPTEILKARTIIDVMERDQLVLVLLIMLRDLE